MIVAENALVLAAGLVIGTVCALVAIVPAIASRGGHVAVLSMGVWLAVILITGLAAVALSSMLLMRLPLLSALHSE